ncbi:ribonuclease III [Nesterenkonia sp. MY13]|uniref:Ribonuclease 3 n=1 Tax=Nesterenkonia sedimenti TaxID=1463632 RepID=A0A7X8YCY2_9MICC|nr:ribonuclease III [Nesterenkonia sedimenti]NLS08542.1 ribonuclease III [Nesterenkonia sedimenti]
MAESTTLLKSLGVHIDPEALRLALTHRSYAYENDGIATNERLEFLGDSVLGLSVTDHLYRTFTDLSEGDLAKLRAALVSTRALARIARTLELGPHIRLGEGELRTGGADKDSILADTMEALIGAAYLSTNIETARQLVLRLVTPLLSDKEAMTAGKDWKTTIQELAAAQELGEISYVIADSGPDHKKSFTATLTIDGATYGTGSGSSKKEAEREAARTTVEQLTGGDGEADILTLVLDRYEPGKV